MGPGAGISLAPREAKGITYRAEGDESGTRGSGCRSCREVFEYRLERPSHLCRTESLGHRGVADLTVEVAPPAVSDPGVLLHAAGVGAECAQLREVESGRHRYGAETLRRGPITD